MTAVVERLEPEELFEWFVGQRAAMGLTAVPFGDGSSSALLRALKANNDRRPRQRPRPRRQRGRGRVLRGEDDAAGGCRDPGAAHRGAAAARRRLLGPGELAHGRRAPAARHLPPGPDARGHRAGDPGPGHHFEHDIRARPEQWHLYQPNWPSDPPMKIAMVSPYSLARPGGVQGQVVGLARVAARPGSRRDRGGAGEQDRRDVPAGVGDHFVIGQPTGLRSNGSVAPVALWPSAAAPRRALRPHTVASTSLHVHEPLAPMAAYGLVLTAPLPMVGTYHRSGVSRWVAPLQPLAAAGGAAPAGACRRLGGGPRDRRCARAVGRSRCCSTGSTWTASSRHHRTGTPRAVPTVLFLGRHEPRKGLPRPPRGLRRVCERPAVLWVSGDGPGTEVQRRRQLASRTRCSGSGCLSDDEVASRLAGADVAVRPVPARASPSAWCSSRAWRPAVPWWPPTSRATAWAAGGHATLVPPGDAAALARALDERAGRCRQRPRRSRPARQRRSTPGPGRWTPWPSATSRCTGGRSRPSARR